MKNDTINKLFVLALCITSSFCFGQQNRSAVCHLGEATNDSLLPYITALEIDSRNDAEKFIKNAEQLTSLSSLTLKGDAKENNWRELFQKLKTTSSLRTVIFDSTTFQSLPYGYEGLYYIENLVIQNNEELEYPELIQELSLLPNLKELTLDILTIFDLPADISSLKNITKLTLINTDEYISKNDTSFLTLEKESVTYDYSVKNKNDKTIAVKYVATAGEIDSDEYKELAKRFTTTTNFGKAHVAFTPKYVNVNPPIKGIDVERTNYIINPQIENIVTYPSGTKILIPANTFIDNTGNPVKTSVTISYREFRDPVEFLVSGIPMKYDTGGVVTNFESAGMFELTASSKNEPITVAKDKSIDMNFATTSKDSTYNFYAFNDEKDNWEYLNKPTVVTKKTAIQLKTPSPAFYIYQNYAINNKPIYDLTPFKDRFEDNKYVYTNRKENIKNSRLYYRSKRKKRSKSMYSLVKINNVKKTKEGTVLFKVTYLDKSHPEMRQFSNAYFASNENMTANEFKQKYSRKTYYNDIRISQIGDDINMELKGKESIKNISATLVSLDTKGEAKPMRNFSNRMNRYNKRLKTRERLFNKGLKKGKNSLNEIIIKDQKQLRIYAFNEAQKAMNPEEKKMNFNEWLDYCKQTEKNILAWNKQSNDIKLAQLNNAEATGSNLIQNLSLSGTGIYNCDQIQRLKNPVEIFARYKTKNNERIRPQSAYILDKRSNSIFQYDGSYDYNAGNIKFSNSPKAENTLLALNIDGSLSIYRKDEFKRNKFTNKSSFDFEVTKIDAKYTTVNELKALIGF